MPSSATSSRASAAAALPASRLWMRSTHACSSSSEKALSRLVIGTVWTTGAKTVVWGRPPTVWVGESGVMSSGNSSSRARRRRPSSSYSASVIVGSSSSW